MPKLPKDNNSKKKNLNIQILFLNGPTNEQTHARTDKPNAICPFNFFKVGGIKIKKKKNIFIT